MRGYCHEGGLSLGNHFTLPFSSSSSQVMKGYLDNEEATRNTITPDGWLHSGDIAYYDDTNHVFIVDRLKELIKVKGFQVIPKSDFKCQMPF